MTAGAPHRVRARRASCAPAARRGGAQARQRERGVAGPRHGGADCSSPARRPRPRRCSSAGARVGRAHRGRGGGQPGLRPAATPTSASCCCARRSPRPSSAAEFAGERAGAARGRRSGAGRPRRGRRARAPTAPSRGPTPAGSAQRRRKTCARAPSVDLRAAMALAAAPRQHRAPVPRRLRRSVRAGLARAAAWVYPMRADAADWAPTPQPTACVQRVYLALLGTLSPIHTLFANTARPWHTLSCAAAQAWRRAPRGAALDADPAFAAWDESLKARGINPGTSADLTVAALLIAGRRAGRRDGARAGGMERDKAKRRAASTASVSPYPRTTPQETETPWQRSIA